MTHWYGLPTDPSYYQRAACTITGENARFYDDSDSNATPLHGNAICSVDCLMPQKNAILPAIFFDKLPSAVAVGCQQLPDNLKPRLTCRQLMSQSAFDTSYSISPHTGVVAACAQQSFTNILAGQELTRIRIFDVTWAVPNIGGDFTDPTDLYNPQTGTGLFGGSLWSPDDSRIAPWLAQYVQHSGNAPGDNMISSAIGQCSLSLPDNDGIGQQQKSIDKCRDTYTGAYSGYVPSGQEHVAGYYGTIPLIPSAYDKQPSMAGQCQYVYEISDNTVCPKINAVCGLLNGHWTFGLNNLTLENISAKISDHLCQNFAPGQAPSGDSVKRIYLEEPSFSPTSTYFAGLGGDMTGQRPTLEPQSYPAYIYRSCTLQSYDADQKNCCANDFADLQGSSQFTPQIHQPPTPNPLTPQAHRAALIGYTYDKATPWYKNCFDSTGLTCAEDVRDIIGPGCQFYMRAHCATNPKDSSPDSWDVSNTSGSTECSRWLGRLLYGYGGTWVNFLNIVSVRGQLPDLSGTNLSFEVLTDILNSYTSVFNMENIRTDTLSPLARQMEPVIFTLYKSYNLALYDGGLLVGQCERYTIDDVRHNPSLRRWCGCLLNATSYSSYYPQISTACTPTCNSSDVIQFGQPCVGTECILDQLTIDLIGSRAGAVSIIQVCQSCGQITSSDTSSIRQVCQCIVDNTLIQAINSTIGTITISEFCTSGNNTPATKPPAAQRALNAAASVTQSFPYTLVSLLVAIGILALVAYFISRGMKKGNSYLWARGLVVALLIIAIVILAGITYSITMMTIG